MTRSLKKKNYKWVVAVLMWGWYADKYQYISSVIIEIYLLLSLDDMKHRSNPQPRL